MKENDPYPLKPFSKQPMLSLCCPLRFHILFSALFLILLVILFIRISAGWLIRKGGSSRLGCRYGLLWSLYLWWLAVTFRSR